MTYAPEYFGGGGGGGGSVVLSGGNLPDIIIGDDYSTANGRPFEWTVNLPAGATIAGATCFFGGEHKLPHLGLTNKWLVQGTVRAAPLETQAIISFDLLRSHTLNLTPGQYNWSAEIRNDTGLQSTRVMSKKTRRVTLVEKQTI